MGHFTAEQWLTETPAAIKPEVGMGVTINVGSDRYAGTIVAVTPSTITYQRDNSRMTGDPRLGSVSSVHVANPNAKREVARRAADGSYYSAGGRRRGRPVSIGRRDYYRDPCF